MSEYLEFAKTLYSKRKTRRSTRCTINRTRLVEMKMIQAAAKGYQSGRSDEDIQRFFTEAHPVCRGGRAWVVEIPSFFNCHPCHRQTITRTMRRTRKNPQASVVNITLAIRSKRASTLSKILNCLNSVKIPHFHPPSSTD